MVHKCSKPSLMNSGTFAHRAAAKQSLACARWKQGEGTHLLVWGRLVAWRVENDKKQGTSAVTGVNAGLAVLPARLAR
jgi:hypothetical protein